MDHRSLWQAAIFLLTGLLVTPSPVLADENIFKSMMIDHLSSKVDYTNSSIPSTIEDTFEQPKAIAGGKFLGWLMGTCDDKGRSVEIGILYSIAGKNSGNVSCDGKYGTGVRQAGTGTYESTVLIGSDGIFDLTGTFSDKWIFVGTPSWGKENIQQRAKIKLSTTECQILYYEVKEYYEYGLGSATTTVRNTAQTTCKYIH